MEINLSIGFISYVASGLLSLFLLIIYFIGVQKENKGTPFFLLVLATLVWSILLIMSQIGASNAFDLVMVAELLRYYTWFYVLLIAAGKHFEKPFRFSASDPLSLFNISIFFLLALPLVIFNEQWTSLFNLTSPIFIQIGLMLVLSVLGLVMVEQLFRNTAQSDRWMINFLCISAGAIFIYDFFVYSNAFLIQSIDYEFWSARGLVNAVVMPAIVLAAVRSPLLAPEIHVSRTFVFHSTALFVTGVYLILMSLAGLYIRESSGDWGKVLQATFLFSAILVLVFLYFSSSIKTRIKRYLVYSFRNKYDYRDEWNRFSHTLLESNSGESIYLRSLRSIAQIVESGGASLWINDHHKYSLRAEYKVNASHRENERDDSLLVSFIHKNHDLFDCDTFKNYAKIKGLSDHWFLKARNSWLIIPLWVDKGLFGFVHLRQSVVGMQLGIEDHDLLNTIAHHVALSLSLKQTDAELQQAERFKEVNQITAFLMHDLKTVLSQLTLLVENGKVHRNNPAFIDDMFNTVEHVSQKMQRLVQQLKQPEQKFEENEINFIEVIKNIFKSYEKHATDIDFINQHDLNPVLQCNKENLTSALKHIVQNALESCGKNGQVVLELAPQGPSKVLLKITDNGTGMSKEFISERLFQPFDSTKGVSGMGVGAYQSREFFRSLNGDLSVVSTPGTGTTFTITIPVKHD